MQTLHESSDQMLPHQGGPPGQSTPRWGQVSVQDSSGIRSDVDGHATTKPYQVDPRTRPAQAIGEIWDATGPVDRERATHGASLRPRPDHSAQTRRRTWCKRISVPHRAPKKKNHQSRPPRGPVFQYGDPLGPMGFRVYCPSSSDICWEVSVFQDTPIWLLQGFCTSLTVKLHKIMDVHPCPLQRTSRRSASTCAIGRSLRNYIIAPTTLSITHTNTMRQLLLLVQKNKKDLASSSWAKFQASPSELY